MDILIIRFSSLGDVVMTSAAVEALKRNFPESHIYYLTKKQYSQIFESDERIYKVIGITGNESPFEIAKSLGRKDFDAVIDLHGSIRSILVSSALRSPKKLRIVKHSLARRLMILSRNRYRRTFDFLGSIMDTLKPLDISWREMPKIVPDESVADIARSVLNIENGGRDHKIIGIAPGSRHVTKRWNEHSFAGLADAISANGDVPVFLGDKSDTPVIDRIGAMIGSEPFSLAGKIDITTTVSVISHLDSLVTNDSGPMHIAGALGVPCAAVFGPTHPVLGFCPGYPAVSIFHSGAVCSPCSIHGATPCRMPRRFCMDDITDEAIFDSLYGSKKMFD
ncbi:glycosyltransferase family 9 protein [Candidatus Latescibacterota bacterium]